MNAPAAQEIQAAKTSVRRRSVRLKKGKALAAEKRERERRERQHAQLAKMERDRKLGKGYWRR